MYHRYFEVFLGFYLGICKVFVGWFTGGYMVVNTLCAVAFGIIGE